MPNTQQEVNTPDLQHKVANGIEALSVRTDRAYLLLHVETYHSRIRQYLNAMDSSNQINSQFAIH